ncbi:glycosyltransferase family 2 protein [Terrimonas sp.]|uniref:glycosyltransferase family 2 protein n=1 Tax=Terrimonas sp. TaxID=1914338 RepID=UPI000D51CD6B|nr:glycosyltransferase family A protein [Terrimonas sp.]PVD52649.1 glycosyltransferase family 2 protein [Terrimonas sp.]
MFSVVIPLYNKAHTIVCTLQAVLNQTYTEFEVVIIDDGSSDNGVELIQKFTKDRRVRIINQQNQGVSAARNRGITESKNEWIAFLDADDEWDKKYLESTKDAIEQFSEAGMIINGRCSKNFQTKIINNQVPKRYVEYVGFIDFFHNPHVFAHISATVVKKSLVLLNFKTWGSFIAGQKSNEDFVFLFRTALHTKVVYNGFPLAFYNGAVEGQATSSLSKSVKLNDSIFFHNKVMEEWLNTGKENKSFKIFMKYEIRHIWSIQIKNKDYDSLNKFITNLHTGYDQLFSVIEKKAMRIRKLNTLMKGYILITKLRWIIRGYPRVS